MNSNDFELVASAIARLVEEPAPGIAELAPSLGVSPARLQRAFSDWAGVSPKRFQQFLSKERCMAALRSEPDVLSASLAAGISSPGRMHDLLVSCEAVTPGEVARLGATLTIRHAHATTRLGEVSIAATARGICHLSFAADADAGLAELRRAWPLADLVPDPALGRLAAELLEGRSPFRLWVRGTNFQIKVWEALLRIPSGALVSYGELARRAGAPGAARAVGSAVGANPVAVLIPCHRVIRESGALGQYRWGEGRKAALLGREAIEHEKARRRAGLGEGTGDGLIAACPVADA